MSTVPPSISARLDEVFSVYIPAPHADIAKLLEICTKTHRRLETEGSFDTVKGKTSEMLCAGGH
jgi:hypothetical protein